MATERTFTVAGISTDPNGFKTFRFSNSSPNQRTSMLSTNGHTDIDLRELPKPMDQIRAIAWVLANVRGSRGAVIATRASDRTVKSETLIEAEALYQKQKSKPTPATKAAAPKKSNARRGPGRPRNDEAIAA